MDGSVLHSRFLSETLRSFQIFSIPNLNVPLFQDTSKALEISLKSFLEGICDTFFGPGCEKRWVDAYFPFTHPSYELEVGTFFVSVKVIVYQWE